MRRLFLIGLPYLWLLLFFLVPFATVLRLALSDADLAIPPYTPRWETPGWAGLRDVIAGWDLENFVWLTGDPLYYRAYLSSLWIAAVATVLTVLVAYPIAWSMAQASPRWRTVLVLLVILPFWTSFLIRVYAWIGILSNEGLLNQVLMAVGLISDPLIILNTNTAVYIGIVYTYLPFAVLPIYANVERMDPALLEAACDLGCSRL
ncbi:MAG: ABC transporter permease, partial [Pseudomonadota bacterium]